jgi:3-methyladenine DNA glycosylase AlkD
MSLDEILKKLKSLGDPKNVEGMARFGISAKKTFGVSIPNLRKLAKEIGKDHHLALELWRSGIHEARILASMIDEVGQVTEKQMDAWIADFDSWDVCDQVCMNLFDKTTFAFEKAKEWAKRDRPARIAKQSIAGGEFEKRAGFALMACLAWHDKESNDKKFIQFFPLITKNADDERNFVKKAVNWALRQIGKRNKKLNKEAIKVSKEVQKKDSKAAKWIANDALRELQSPAVQKRLGD